MVRYSRFPITLFLRIVLTEGSIDRRNVCFYDYDYEHATIYSNLYNGNDIFLYISHDYLYASSQLFFFKGRIRPEEIKGKLTLFLAATLSCVLSIISGTYLTFCSDISLGL